MNNTIGAKLDKGYEPDRSNEDVKTVNAEGVAEFARLVADNRDIGADYLATNVIDFLNAQILGLKKDSKLTEEKPEKKETAVDIIDFHKHKQEGNKLWATW